MADSGRLSETVTEDAVPLELPHRGGGNPRSTLAPFQRSQMTAIDQAPGQPLNAAGGGNDPACQPASCREGMVLEPPEHQTRSRTAAIPSAVSAAVCSERLQQGPEHSEDEAMMEKDVLKGVKKAVDKAFSKAELSGHHKPPLPSSSQPSSLVMPLKALSLVPTVVSDDDIKKYRHHFPDDLKLDYYDAMILYQEDDIHPVTNFLKRVNDGVLLNKVEKPKVVLYDQILPCAGQRVADVDKTLDYCTYVFLYVTKKFCEDKWTEFAGQTALMNAIDNMESRWSVVPIFTEPKRSPTFKIPPSIRSLKGIQYWNEDKFYVDSLRKLLEDKLHLRLQNEEEQKRKRKLWILQYEQTKRQKAERKRQEEEHALQVQAEEDRRHQQELQLRDQHFQQVMHKQRQQKIQIPDFQAELDRFKNQNPRDQERQYDNYFNYLRQEHNTTPANKVGSGGENLGQQGMPDLPYLHHSMSYPNCLGKQPPEPSFLYPAHMAPHQHPWAYDTPAGYPGQWKVPPSAHLSAPSSHLPSTFHPSGSFSWPDTSSFSIQRQRVMQVKSGDKLPPGDAKDVVSMWLHPGDGAQLQQAQPATPVSSSAPQTCPPDQPTEVPEDGGNVGKQTLDRGTDQVAQFTVRRDTQAVQRHQGHSNTSEIAQEKDQSLGSKRKDDLVEDVDSRGYQSPYPVPHQQQTLGHVGAAHFSEAIQQAPLFAHGPAHYGHIRARAQPDGREEDHYDPRLTYSGHAGIGEGYYGYGHSQYMHPSSSPGQLPLSAYPAQHPLAYPRPLPFPAFPEYYAPRLPYQGYAGYVPQQGYPGMGHGYGTRPLPPHQVVPPVAPESTGHIQFPGQGYPWQPIPVLAPASQQQAPYPQENQLPSPPPAPAPPPASAPAPAVVHHHHYHHGNQDSETSPPTINIKNAENVMVGEKITVDVGGRGRPPSCHEEEAPDSRFEPQNQPARVDPASSTRVRHREPVHDDEAMRGQESSSVQPPSVYYSSEWSLTGLGDQHQNQSQLTQNVSRDDRSQQQTSSLPSSGLPPQVGMAELPPGSHRMYPGQTASFPSSSHPHFPPLQAEPQGGWNTGSDATYTTPGLDHWPDDYEQERETMLKLYVVGPSADEGSLPGDEAGDNTSIKTRGSRE